MQDGGLRPPSCITHISRGICHFEGKGLRSSAFDREKTCRNNPVTINWTNRVRFIYHSDVTAIPKKLNYFLPGRQKQIPFIPTNTVKSNFPLNPNSTHPFARTHPYAIRIKGYFGKRYPSYMGTIYFPDFEIFYNFSKYVYQGQ